MVTEFCSQAIHPQHCSIFKALHQLCTACVFLNSQTLARSIPHLGSEHICSVQSLSNVKEANELKLQQVLFIRSCRLISRQHKSDGKLCDACIRSTLSGWELSQGP